ncbi:MAG: IscS subfamily cysteine desulfurase [Nitrospirota bacterium]|nr:MAG: IscS subfamily cysteine desulfurase [Nitrospirota bacterium]
MAEEKRGICGICSAGCWIIAEYDRSGKIVNVRADESSDMGIICTIGKYSPEIIYSDDRLLYPMKRKGPKGSYDFERITWDEAYGTIADKLQKIKKEHGPEAAAVYTGVGTFELSLCDIFQPKGVAISSASSVLFPFGSPNTMGVGALCYVAYGMIAPDVTCGKMLFDTFNDLRNSEVIVIWGTNPSTDLPPIDMQRIIEANERGAHIVVIDPRKTRSAKLEGAEWVPVRPGTDGALALGMCNVLIEEELYDEDFVNNWTVGFEEFAQYAQHFGPEVVQGITGIRKDTIISLARRIAQAKGVSQLMYTGLEYSNCGVQAIRASLVLWALAGQLDVPGGRCFKMPGSSFPINKEGNVQSPYGSRKIAGDRFPVYTKYRDEAHASGLPDSILNGDPYKTRALIIQGASVTTSWPNPELWQKALSELELLVCIDRQMTADTKFADIVLPASTYYENESYMVYDSVFRKRERMIEPLGESRNDLLIMAELAKRLGYGHLYPQSERELIEHVLKGSGYTYEDLEKAEGILAVDTGMMQYKKWERGLLRKDGQPGFDTPSGKFEIASSVLEEYGYDALPVYTEPQEGPLSRPDLLKDYPLVFNSGSRVKTGFHTQHRGIKKLVEKRPEPAVTINTEDAGERGIENGDLVRIKTPRGSLTMRALVTDNIVKGAIDANHACGSPVGPDAWQKRNINSLTDMDQFDPISGFPVYKCLLCDIEKAESGSSSAPADFGEAEDSELRQKKVITKRHEVYLDNNATTPLAPEVKKAMSDAMENYGNPSSIHTAGKRARSVVESARRSIASALNCTARRIVFTGSGSEADNLAIRGVASISRGKKDHIITSSIEHPAVINTCERLEKEGFNVTYLPVNSRGLIEIEEVSSAITDRTCLISIMLANNETGVIQPVRECAAIAKERGVIFHTDAVQAFGKIPVDVEELGVDLLSVSAHKVNGPKGVGALYVRRGIELEAIISGGGHEHGLRAGTENVIGIAGFGKAADLIPRYLERSSSISGLRNKLEAEIYRISSDMIINGDLGKRLPNTSNITLPGLRGESVVLELARRGVYLSSGSACKSGSSKPSHALLAMGMSEDHAHCALRFSLGPETNEDDIDYAIECLADTVQSSKNMIHFVPCR